MTEGWTNGRRTVHGRATMKGKSPASAQGPRLRRGDIAVARRHAMLGREPRVQSPVLNAYSDMPLYNTKAVVHQTGVPAPTLRAWERRYGILTPRRGDNDYRLYSERDMMLVAWLRERVEGGMTISQAIALLHTLEPPRRRGSRRTRPVPAAPEQMVSQPSLFPPPRIALPHLGPGLLPHL